LQTISSCEMLTYFKYTPVKPKVINNTHFCVVICILDHTAMLTPCTHPTLLLRNITFMLTSVRGWVNPRA
jgi:hypothetical protein